MSYGDSVTKYHDWGYNTVSQANAGGAAKKWPRGKLLGGSGAVNGMFWGRASSHEYDAWADLNPGTNVTWNWDEVDKYIKKAENLGSPSQSNIDTFHIPIDRTAHGSSGPIHVGWSEYIYPFTANWVPSWEALGFTSRDLAAGECHGVSITPSTMFQDNQTRCDSKAGYIDSQPDRANLVILTNQQVTEVLFNGTKDASGNAVASGVSFSASSGSAVYSVQANKEVILAGGTIGSPQILQLSGIGPQKILSGLDIPVVKDLPVGYNLQDHASATMYFGTTQIDNWADFWGANGAATRAAALEEWRTNKTGIYTYINEAVGYVSMSDISSAAEATSTANEINVATTVQDVTSAHDLPSNVASGLTAQYNILKNWLKDTTGQLEIILTMWGSTSNNIGIQVALQHPFSRGTLMINSKNAFSAPTIDPSYFAVDIDRQIMGSGAAWVRKLVASGPFKSAITGETGGSAGLTGSALTTYIQGLASTEYHPHGTCSMLPEDMGGVVDTRLVVYGTNNVRVIDSSIIPLHISAHLMSTTYGIAEKGADIIKQAYWKPPPPPESSSAAATATSEEVAVIGDATDSAVADAQRGASTTGLSTAAKIGVGVGAGVGAGAILGAILFLCCIRKKKRPVADEKGWYAGANQDSGAWDAQQAYREQDAYPMGGMAAPRPNRFSSAAASISTMATEDLRGLHPGQREDSSYSLGDYARGGSASPYRDDPSPLPPAGQQYPTGFQTPGSPNAGFGFGQQHYTPVVPK